MPLSRLPHGSQQQRNPWHWSRAVPPSVPYKVLQQQPLGREEGQWSASCHAITSVALAWTSAGHVLRERETLLRMPISQAWQGLLGPLRKAKLQNSWIKRAAKGFGFSVASFCFVGPASTGDLISLLHHMDCGPKAAPTSPWPDCKKGKGHQNRAPSLLEPRVFF